MSTANKPSIVVLGAGFGGLELTTLLSEELGDSIDVTLIDRSDSFDEVNQRVRFVVSGELACRPLDIPIEFVAEVDVGSGKVQLTRLPAST